MCRPGRKGRADLTSSPPSSRLAAAVPPESPALPAGNRRQGLRSLWHLSRHLTARADDNHAAPTRRPSPAARSPAHSPWFQARVRFLAYHRIKPHVPPLVRAPVNSFEFQPCSDHRLLRGLPGYLILFDPHAFVPQRQTRPGGLPPQSAFCAISMHFTATPHIPPPSSDLKGDGFNGTATVEPLSFTADFSPRLRTL